MSKQNRAASKPAPGKGGAAKPAAHKATGARAGARKPAGPNYLLIAGGALLVILVVVAVVLLRPGAGAPAAPAEISVEQARQKYDSGVFVLDVREQEEWNEAHIPNTTLIPLGELSTRVSELPKDQEIVVVCRSGNRSQQGRDILLNAGFTSVSSMAGGVNQWTAAGYPTTSGP